MHQKDTSRYAVSANLGGRERTKQEFATVLRASGYELQGVIVTPTPVSIIEALPVQIAYLGKALRITSVAMKLPTIGLVDAQTLDDVIDLFEAQLREHDITRSRNDLRAVAQAVIADRRYGFMLVARAPMVAQ